MLRLICRISVEPTNFDMTYDAILMVSFGDRNPGKTCCPSSKMCYADEMFPANGC